MDEISIFFNKRESVPIESFPSIFTVFVRAWVAREYYSKSDGGSELRKPNLLFALDHGLTEEYVDMLCTKCVDIPDEMLRIMNLGICSYDKECDECGVRSERLVLVRGIDAD